MSNVKAILDTAPRCSLADAMRGDWYAANGERAKEALRVHIQTCSVCLRRAEIYKRAGEQVPPLSDFYETD